MRRAFSHGVPARSRGSLCAGTGAPGPPALSPPDKGALFPACGGSSRLNVGWVRVARSCCRRDPNAGGWGDPNTGIPLLQPLLGSPHSSSSSRGSGQGEQPPLRAAGLRLGPKGGSGAFWAAEGEGGPAGHRTKPHPRPHPHWGDGARTGGKVSGEGGGGWQCDTHRHLSPTSSPLSPSRSPPAMNFPRLGGPPLTPSAAVRIPQSLADAKAGPGATKATGASTGQESSPHARGQRASFLHKGSKHKAPSFGTPSTSPTCTLPRQKQPGKAKGA